MKPISPMARAEPILRRLPAGDVLVAEIGVFVGTLSRYLLQRRRDLRLIMVDDWACEAQQPREYRATGDRHAHQTPEECEVFRLAAKRNVHAYRDRVTLINARSRDAATRIDDQSIDLVFLDADHSDVGLFSDLCSWWPKVKPGGWIGGHDYGNVAEADFSGVKRALDAWRGERMIELDSDHTWFCRC